jgi:zinc transport system substrate-binding protein
MRLALSSLALLCPLPALADVPRVVTDIAPVQSLVAQVMTGVGEADVLVGPTDSPHSFSLRPSKAAAVQQADLIVWIGASLTPQLDETFDALGDGAQILTLSMAEGVRLLDVREGDTFAAHDHDHGHEDHDDHGDEDHHDEDGHDDHAHDEDHAEDKHAEGEDHAHEEHDDHEEHAADKDHDLDGHDDHEDHADHDDHHDDHHGEHAEELDPHLWLDPANGQVWLAAIAEALSALDPGNAATYAANAAEGIAALETQIADLTTTMAAVADTPFIVQHDAYQYFESRFGLAAAGTIADFEGEAPGPAHLAELREAIGSLDGVCLFTEYGTSPAFVATVTEGLPVRVSEVDPLGAKLAPGASLYPALIADMAGSMAGCLGSK